ncbi:MAG TPA: DUF6519 domain-containing protein, partial [Nitrospiraceae bacterium]|nr:DUF6519 domain-containing protein [Nitrospiraceae bacterium]
PNEFKHFKIAVEQNGTDLRVAPGRMYVDGILCENDDANGVLFTQQPDLLGAALPSANGSYAVYLDVWERHLSPVDQHGDDFPLLRESALNGPDTATRTRIVWQVKLAPVQSKSCGAFTKPPDPTGMLRAQEIKSADPGNDCLVPSGGGYRRLENQLYRVEIHDVVQGIPSFKWSRDNGSVVSKVKAIDANALTIVVEDPGRDEALGFAGAKWVELTDEERVFRGEPSALFQVKTVTGTSVVVLNPTNLSLAIGTNPTLRRWDGTGTVAATSPVELEDGVQIEFDGGTFTGGDYWLIPARTLTGKVEWRRNGGNPPAPVFERRHGTVHHYCALAVVDLTDGSFGEPLDCRELFPPLTDIAASDVSYDPAKCANLSSAKTVQEAIDILCMAAGGEEPGIRIQKVTLLSGKPLQNDTVVDPKELARGVRITCDKPLFQDSVRNQKGLPNPVCLITLDLPWPINNTDRELWKVGSAGIVGYQTTTLAANVNADGNDIFWVPLTQAPNTVQQWLAESLLSTIFNQTHGQVQRVLARLTLKGNFIWGQENAKVYLDGDAFGVPGDQATGITFPTGNGRRGGDFEMWFWLAQPPQPTPTLTTPTLTIPTFTIPTITATIIQPTLTLTSPTLTLPTFTITGPITLPTLVTPPIHGAPGPTVIVPPRPDRVRTTARQPLTSVRGLTRNQSKKLEAAGIRDAAALAGSDPSEVAAALGLRDRAKAEALIEEAKRLSQQP